MDKPEREKTARFAKEKINDFLDNGGYTSALMLASIYVNLRLRSLLTEYISPTENKWRTVSNKLDIGFNRLLSLCKELNLLYGFNVEPLKRLYNRRCKIAHESELWKKILPKDKEEIKSLCESAIEFLENTIR